MLTEGEIHPAMQQELAGNCRNSAMSPGRFSMCHLCTGSTITVVPSSYASTLSYNLPTQITSCHMLQQVAKAPTRCSHAGAMLLLWSAHDTKRRHTLTQSAQQPSPLIVTTDHTCTTYIHNICNTQPLSISPVSLITRSFVPTC